MNGSQGVRLYALCPKSIRHQRRQKHGAHVTQRVDNPPLPTISTEVHCRCKTMGKLRMEHSGTEEGNREEKAERKRSS